MSAIKILVVDDEEDVEFLFSQKFRKDIREGAINLTYTFSGEEALYFIRNKEPMDIVVLLSDIKMPGMNGLDLIKIVKQEFPEMKVIIISAYADETNMEKAKQYGADAFIAKPVDFEELKQKVRDLGTEVA